jgi:hypothetical protein
MGVVHNELCALAAAKGGELRSAWSERVEDIARDVIGAESDHALMANEDLNNEKSGERAKAVDASIGVEVARVVRKVKEYLIVGWNGDEI